jgi:hypothetical protein
MPRCTDVFTRFCPFTPSAIVNLRVHAQGDASRRGAVWGRHGDAIATCGQRMRAGSRAPFEHPRPLYREALSMGLGRGALLENFRRKMSLFAQSAPLAKPISSLCSMAPKKAAAKVRAWVTAVGGWRRVQVV